MGCRYEYAYGSSRGECWLTDDTEIPRDAMCRIDDLTIEHGRIKSENAKLRELVEMLYECPKAPECDECKRLNGDYACAYLMRELGFEVE